MTNNDNIASRVSQLVNDLLQKLGITGTVRVQERETNYYVSIETDDSAILIGRAGETLEALQSILRLMFQQMDLGDDIRVTVDVNGYRRGREEELLTFVSEVAERVKSSGLAEVLRPMTSYERRLVHEVIGGIEGVESVSEGEGRERRITIRTNNK